MNNQDDDFYRKAAIGLRNRFLPGMRMSMALEAAEIHCNLLIELNYEVEQYTRIREWVRWLNDMADKPA